MPMESPEIQLKALNNALRRVHGGREYRVQYRQHRTSLSPLISFHHAVATAR